MKKFNFNQSVGFPMETEILAEMQKSWQLLNALGYIVGNFSIISGCELTGDTVSDGVVFINGEPYEFKGGIPTTNVVIVEEAQALEFEDTVSRDVIFDRYVTFGTASTMFPWADFKRGYQTKDIEGALAGKVSSLTITKLLNRVTELETKTAVFQTGGGMVFWNKPAADIPAGWQEVIDWRGRMPVGWNPEDSNFDVVGKTGGSKHTEIPLQIPVSGYNPSVNTSGGNSGYLIVSTGDVENAENLESLKKASAAPEITVEVDHMNPYRVVMFIEYITPIITP